MNRIEKRFKALKKNREKAFIAFITAGYPSINITYKLVKKFSAMGVDAVELGVPFSDPMADGPVIQEASQYALKRGINLRKILGLVGSLRKSGCDIPIALMSYYNPIFCFGENKFLRLARASGVDGIIIPDLPPEAGRQFVRAANKNGIDNICFISPTTPLKRIKAVSATAKGFIYYISLTGVTGMRRGLAAGLRKNLRAIKGISDKPVCVGFGVSRACQVRRIKAIADGVIVGSAIVKKIKENIGNKDLLQKVGPFVAGLIRSIR